jgi:small-conductance mechanosensitive channel
MDFEFSIGGYNIKGWMLAVGIPVLSSVAGGVWWSYDTLQRFYAVEAGIETVVSLAGTFETTSVALSSRIQTLEQAIQDNDVRGLNQKLASLQTNMQTILEQQQTLLNMRSQVDKATTITDGLGNKLDVINQEIDDIWEAYDYLKDNPLK